MTAPSLSLAAEESIALLYQTLGFHDEAAHASTSESERRGRLARVTSDVRQIQRQATVLRMVSITESFCARLLLEAGEASVRPATNPIVSILWDRASVDATGTWEAQRDAFKKWFGVTPDWQALDSWATIRNAIAHGLGVLTRRQLQNRTSTLAKIHRVGVTVADNRLVLTDDDLRNAARACRDLIVELDAAAPNQALPTVS